jgi:hypothetical protein
MNFKLILQILSLWKMMLAPGQHLIYFVWSTLETCRMHYVAFLFPKPGHYLHTHRKVRLPLADLNIC